MKKIERFISGIADTVRGDIRAANALDEDEVYVTLKTKCGRIYIDYSASEPVVEVSHNGSYHESPNRTPCRSFSQCNIGVVSYASTTSMSI